MKILVTGGAGFIGFHTCKELIEQGHQVVVLDDLSTGKSSNIHDLSDLGGELEFHLGSVLNSHNLAKSIEGVDSVIHLAAKVSVKESIDTPSLTSMTNVQGFINVANQARLHGIKRLVYASSSAIYGDKNPAAYEECYQPLSPYGLDKLTNETYADLFGRLYKLQTLGLRYFNVYGPRQDPSSPYAGVIGKFISLVLRGLPLTVYGTGEQVRNFVYVEDIAKVNAAAVLGSAVFNGQIPIDVAKPRGEITLNQLIRKISLTVRKPVTISYDPPIAGEVFKSIPNLDQLSVLYSEYGSMIPLDEGLVHLVEYIRERLHE